MNISQVVERARSFMQRALNKINLNGNLEVTGFNRIKIRERSATKF